MPKIYTNTNVYDACIERLEIIFNNFNNVYFSISGGKDSSVMLQLAGQVARKLGKQFDVLYIDLEAQYKATIEHIENLKKEYDDVINDFYWVCLPLSLRNAVSVLQPKWTCWNPEDKSKWVRPLPKNSININNCEWEWFKFDMEFEEFIILFAEYYTQKHGNTPCACGVGIRSDESLNRFRTIVNDKKETFNGYMWTTRIKRNSEFLNIYNFYPIYDWKTKDIWTCVGKYDLLFNEIYELMYKNGVSIHQQRLCQPYGDDQRGSLDQFRELEPETWEKVLNRVEGVNFGNIYARTSLLGNIKSEKPQHMTWQEYSIFLLESLGLYAPELRDHYYHKISKFFDWYKKNEGLNVGDVRDVEDKKLESSKKVPSWRRIGRAIERNDFWLSRLSFSQTKKDKELLKQMKKKYGANLIKEENTNSKPLIRLAKEVNIL